MKPRYDEDMIMGGGTNGITFNALRGANTNRVGEFRNARGELAHSKKDGSDWCLAQWGNAVCGELGEAANLIKKIERGDRTLDEARDDLGDELADVVIYLDLLAYRAGIELGEAVRRKFNRKSAQVGSRIYINAEGWHRADNPLDPSFWS